MEPESTRWTTSRIETASDPPKPASMEPDSLLKGSRRALPSDGIEKLGESLSIMLWHLQIDPAAGRTDLEGHRIAAEAADLGLPGPWRVAASRGFLVEGALSRDDLQRAAEAILVDPVVETFTIRPCDHAWDRPEAVVHVLPKPGVTDPEAQSALTILRDLGFAAENVRTIRTYQVEGPADALPRLIQRVLANDAVEQAVVGRLPFRPARPGPPLPIPPGRGPDPGHGRRGADAPEHVGPALPEPRRDAGHPAPLRRAGPRPDRLRARDAGPDLERALLAQDLPRPDRVRRPGHRQPAQADHLQGDAATWTSTGSSASSPTTRASSGSTTTSTSASRSRRTTTPPRSTPTAAPTPGSAA